MSSERTPAQERNIALVTLGMEAYNTGELEATLPFIHPEVVIFTAPGLVNSGTYEGLDGYLSWARAWTEAWDEFRLDVLDAIPVGDFDVVVPVRQHGVGAGSGIRVEMDTVFHYRVADEKAIRVGLYEDLEAALEAARASD